MGSYINYQHLFYFKTIAECESITKAAKKLRLGQPTLSAQLKSFEDQIGIELFERHHKKLILTEQGKIALHYAKNIFQMGDEMHQVLLDKLTPSIPELQIASLDSISKEFVSNLVKLALEISPCHITLSEGRIDELVRDLIAHKIDLLVSNFVPTSATAKGLYPKSITKSQISFFGTNKYEYLKKNFPHSISGQPLILPTYDSKLRYDIDHWANSNNIELNVIVESQDISVKKILAFEGVGIIAAADHSIERHEMNERFLKIGHVQGIFEEIFLISAQRKLENKLAKELKSKF